MNKNKPVIEDIEISLDELEKFNSALKTRSQNKNRVIRDYFGGVCTICAEIPSKKILEDLEGYGQRVEYYCDKCFQRWVANTTRTFT